MVATKDLLFCVCCDQQPTDHCSDNRTTLKSPASFVLSLSFYFIYIFNFLTTQITGIFVSSSLVAKLLKLTTANDAGFAATL